MEQTTETDPRDQDWHIVEEGKTIGTIGPEEGIIITDLENINGARITVEKTGEPNPHFVINFGIYGLLFHTHYKSQPAEVEQSITWLKATIKKVFAMYDLPEADRTDDWYHEHDRLVHELTVD